MEEIPLVCGNITIMSGMEKMPLSNFSVR